MLNGEPLLNRDDNNVEIHYAYDALRRVTRETVAPGTAFAAHRRYEYFLCAYTGEQAEQWMFDVKQVKTCTKFDGLNRAIYEERDDADNPSRAGTPRQIYAADYDVFGNLIRESEHDWLGEDVRILTTEYEYDDWGTQYCVTGPDGVKTFEQTDPIGTSESQGPIQRSWREGLLPTPKVSGVTVTWLNLFEKPTRIERFDLAGQPVSLQRNFYDGLGRTVKEIVGFPVLQRETLYRYDAFDRLTENTLPDTAVVRRSYAEHSREDLPISISVNDIELGTQLFDGLDRMISSTTGGREQVFTYEPGQTQPHTVTTPSGEVIEYEYQPELGTDPINYVDPTGHSPWGAVLRLFRGVSPAGRVTTKSAYVENLPKMLVSNSKSRSATLYLIEEKHVARLEKTANLLEYRAQHAEGNTVRQWKRSDDAKAAHEFAQENVGKPGITKDAAANIKSLAKKQVKLIRKIEENQTKLNRIRLFEEKERRRLDHHWNGRKPDPKRFEYRS
jgi:hypothetical protein